IAELPEAGVGRRGSPVTHIKRLRERIDREGLDDVVGVDAAGVRTEFGRADQRVGRQTVNAERVVAAFVADADAEDQARGGIDRDGRFVAESAVAGSGARVAAADIDGADGASVRIDVPQPDVDALVDAIKQLRGRPDGQLPLKVRLRL